MRCDVVLGFCLLVSLAVGVWLWGQWTAGQRRIIALEADIAALEVAREADQQALAVYKRARDHIARESQEKRDALAEISDDLSDDDFLRELRRVCPAGRACDFNAAVGTDARMPAPASSGVYDAR